MAALTWADRRRLALLNTLVVPFIVGPVVTPLLLAAGATSTATAFYRFFHLVCHQWAFRSFFVLGSQATFSFAQFAVLVSPMALDGLTQLVGWRESTWELRIATGVLFGIASGWFLYPRLLAAARTLTPQDSRELASR